LEHYGFKID
jgi:hypothetical protein